MFLVSLVLVVIQVGDTELGCGVSRTYDTSTVSDRHRHTGITNISSTRALTSRADADGSFVSTGACGLEVEGSNPGRAGYLCTVLPMVLYTKKSFEIRVGHSPGFGLPSVAILPWVCRKRRGTIFTHLPADTRRWINVSLTLVQRRKRWTNVNPALIQCLMSAGFSLLILVLMVFISL